MAGIHRGFGKGLEPIYTDETNEVVRAWRRFAATIDPTKLGEIVIGSPDSTVDGDIYEVETPEGLPGDFVVVDMQRVVVDTPHLHTNGEIEIHIPIRGAAKIALGGSVVLDLMPSLPVPVAPDKPHFLIPDSQYVTGILSWPNYDPDNQITIDPDDPRLDFNSHLYSSVIGSAQ